jgi:hypothetical protein
MTRSVLDVVPSIRAGYTRLTQLESRYRCRLGLWVSIHEEANGPGFFQLHVSGSGEAFDYLPAGGGHARARIIPAFDDPFASALWSCLDQLEQALDRHAGYLAHPPSQ